MFSNRFSRLFGYIADTHFPKPIQRLINKAFVSLFHISLAEHDSLNSYQSINELFTRKLSRPRSFDTSQNIFISPADCRLNNCGVISDGLILQIKQKYYPISHLLGRPQMPQELEGGIFANLYLSPSDYHRFHAPCDAKITRAVYIPGALFPVNLFALEKVDALFTKNERVVLELQTASMTFYMIFVGAFNVGRILINFDETIRQNATRKRQIEYRYARTYVQKGDELGRFEMGSSIVLLFPKNTVHITCNEGEKLSFSQTIATINHAT